MRVLFIYSDLAITNQRRFQHGIAYLSSALKSDGCETRLIHIYSRPKKEVFLKRIEDFKPDIIAYSSLTNQYPMVKMLSDWSKDLKTFTLYGGLHPTLAPDICLNTPGIDAIGMGEGDIAIKEFVSHFSKGKDITKIENFWLKSNGNIYKNRIRPLIEDLDELPFPDYDLFPYENTDDYKASFSITLQASRGCLYSCTYCCNHYLKSLYPNREKYLRFRSVANIILELKYLLKKYPKARLVRFTDDALSSNRAWFEEFTQRYKDEIRLPYSVNDHPHNINPRIAKLYRESGCIALSMGIENGNKRIRQEILKRNFSDAEIIQAFTLARRAGINTASFNIIGSPYESMQTVLDTVKLNTKCAPYGYTNAYFQPFLQTEAAQICQKNGWQIKDLPGSFFEEPVVEIPGVSKKQLIFGFKYFGLLVMWYKFLYRFSGGEDSRWVEITDRLLSAKFMPYGLLNAVMISRMEIKQRFPVLGHFLTQIKRAIFKPKF